MAQLMARFPERRERRRIITLKNFGLVAIVFAVIFAALIVRSEFHHTSGDDYGRLLGKQVAGQNEIVKPKFDVIKEAPVQEQTAADPWLLEPAAREQQYLGVPSAAPAAAPASAAAAPVPVGTSGSGVAVVGDAGGVTIVHGANQRTPTLSGGIFKQQP